MARSERTDGGTRPDSTRKRTPRSEPSAAAVDAGLLTQESPLTASMGSDFSQTTLECHAAVLGDSAFLEAEAINDTDLYDYTQQGDEYSVD